MTSASSPPTEPPCPRASAATGEDEGPVSADRTAPRPGGSGANGSALRAVRRPFAAFDQAGWDALADATPSATPFARWAVHRSWWDAYAANAHEQTLAIVGADDPDDASPVAIVPFMHRHEVEPDDAILRTRMRANGGSALTPIGPDRKAIFFGASYHADYATILARPADLGPVAEAVAAALAEPAITGDDHVEPWDVVDLRRLRRDDPAADALADVFAARGRAHGWHVVREQEEVCPVLDLHPGSTYEDYLGTLGKKERHEVRRKIRRAEALGEVRLEPSADPAADLDAFVGLHQKKWGPDGLFPATAGGAQSRTFFARLFERCGAAGTLVLHFLTVGGRRIAAGVWFDDGSTLYFYNAGSDPEARELSPGVLLVARSLEMAIAGGRTRFDFLRGNEPYKYEWGATDVPIQRLLVVRQPA